MVNLVEPEITTPSLSSEGGDKDGGLSPSTPPPQTSRDWAALPRDILCEVFRRTRHADILCGAGLACTAWRGVAAEEPALWRRVDLYEEDYREELGYWTGRMAMGRAAVDRSRGQCESFRGPADRYLLLYLANRAPSLRSLQVTSLWCLPNAFVDLVIPKMPMLEVLTMAGGYLMPSTLHALLRHCPRLDLLDTGQCALHHEITFRLLDECHSKFNVVKVVPGRSPMCFCWTCHLESNGLLAYAYNLDNIIF
ncbi:hypothetical protein PR202_gb02638 [Eleusine coracana subsp. coracana]|uniref:F-box domain-containing protein n=1 Tax=Eleusine coracana subsp. coracana TaxID=191504 RepID=A0AAV5DZT7_ELECO|nr:hypothetical protein QOZ80_8BG0666100 [Eleusine coracana subsp. coracana]GJN15702.1 hypothetical protein PR202_gb02638 [Eleusine coracana subsp. coracana]